jgi:hypothetical protein
MPRYDRGGDEPLLDEVVTDPVVRAVMRRDGVTDEALWATINAARGRLYSRGAGGIAYQARKPGYREK